MASKLVGSYVREDGHLINVYESGAEFDTTIGRICKPASHTIITAENTTEYYRKRMQLKEQRIMQGAAEYLASKNSDRLPEDGDVLHAIGRASMERANNADIKNNKQIDAAKLIIHEGGYGADKNQDQQPAQVNVFVMSDQVMQFLEQIKRRISRTDILISDNPGESAGSRVIDADAGSPTSQDGDE